MKSKALLGFILLCLAFPPQHDETVRGARKHQAASGPVLAGVCTFNNFNSSLTIQVSTRCATSGNPIGGGTFTALTSGQKLFIHFVYTGGSVASSQVTGCSTAWALIGATGISTESMWVTGTATSTGNCSVVFAPGTSGAIYGGMFVWPSAGITTTLDGSIGYQNTSMSGSSANGPSVTTTLADGDIIMTSVFTNSGTGQATNNTPFTADQNTAVGGVYSALGHYIQPARGLITPSYTMAAPATTYASTMAVEP
jgi:hypothetical protein